MIDGGCKKPDDESLEKISSHFKFEDHPGLRVQKSAEVSILVVVVSKACSQNALTLYLPIVRHDRVTD